MAAIDSDTTLKKEPDIENSPTADVTTSEDIRQRIQARAYELYEERGRKDGQAEQDWVQAEQELLSKTGQAAV